MDSNYLEMFTDEMQQRKKFNYPPYCRLISFTLKHKDQNKLNIGADEFTNTLKKKFGTRVLGPEYPVVSRVKNYYQKKVLIKIERKISVSKARDLILEVKHHFEAFSKYKSIRISIDVDPY